MVGSSNWTVRNLTGDWRCLRYLQSATLAPLTVSVRGKKAITLLFAWLSFGFPQIRFYLTISNSTSEHSDDSQLVYLCESVCEYWEGDCCSGWVSWEMLVTYNNDNYPLSAVICFEAVAIFHLSHHTFPLLLTSPPACESGRCEWSLRGCSKLFVATF